ncbi:substrate-binding domain-containing protein [Streptomyces tubercidicus]|uniref:substrate-binding domain-containing protein n=1 Tax=Streptomyces tubercidicus TaxID=47759 RepID=UPI0034668F76
MISARTRAASVVGVAAMLALAACSSGKSDVGADAGQVKKATGKISIAYLQKQGDQQYFVDEADGAKAKAAQLGIDLKVVNLGNDANKAVSEVNSAIAQKANGLIVVPPDPAVGPQIAQAAKDAKIALLTSDDQICTNGPDPAKCSKGDLVPRVGFSGGQMGTEVGKRAAKEFKKSGWKAEDTRIISAWKQDVPVCTDRVKAAKQAFAADAGASVKSIDVATDNTATGAQDKVAATVTGKRDVKHWILWGCNDENVQGGLTALVNSGVSHKNVISVGLGAYLACKDWSADKSSGMRAALFINGRDVGALSVQKMYDRLKNGTQFPAEAFAPTKMVDASDWRNAGLKCS